jgi:hypothetical protein
VRVIPGRSGTMAPYGYFEAQFSDCKVPEQWLRDGGDKTNGAWDFAVIPIRQVIRPNTHATPTGSAISV